MKLQQRWNHMPVDVASYSEMVPGLRRLAARAVKFRTNFVETPFNRRCDTNSFNVPDSYVRRVADQWEKMEHCMGLVQQAERHDGLSYDVVVRSRPDIFWLRGHPPLVKIWPKWPREVGSPIVVDWRVPQTDWHAVLTRKQADLVFSLFSRYRSCRGTQAPFDVLPRFTGEAVWNRTLHMAGHVRRIGFPFVLVRDSLEDAQQSIKSMCDETRGDGRIFLTDCAQVMELAYPNRSR